MRVTVYAFQRDGVFCHLHTHNRACSLLQTAYIEEGMATHDIARKKREEVIQTVNNRYNVNRTNQVFFKYLFEYCCVKNA